MKSNSKIMSSLLAVSLVVSFNVHAEPAPVGQATGQKPVPAAVTTAAPAAATPNAVSAAKPAGVVDTKTKDAKPAPAAAAAKDEKPAAAPVSAQERFRTHTGPRTPAALSELFSAPASAGFRQQPEVVLTTGAEMVTIVASIPAKDAAAPSITFNGAQLLSSEQIAKDQWLFVALPETGVMKAEMIVISNGSTLVVPLSVAPPLPADTDLSEKVSSPFWGQRARMLPPGRCRT